MGKPSGASLIAVRPLNRTHRRLVEGLGLVVSRWAYVEWIEGDFLAYLLGADPGRSHVVSKNVSGASVTDWLRTLTPFQFTHPETQAFLASLFDRIDKARSERNTLVHGLWSAGPEPKTANVMTVKLERVELMRTELVALDDLQSLLAEITDIYRELAAFGDKIGFHPRGRPAGPKCKRK